MPPSPPPPRRYPNRDRSWAAFRRSVWRLFIGRLLFAGLVVGTLLAIVAVFGLPAGYEAYNPFGPLAVSDRPNLFTGFKQRRLAWNPERCEATLAAAAMTVTPLPDRETGEGCGFTNAVQMRRGVRVGFSSEFPASCPLAVAWALFETHTLQPAAREHLGREVRQIIHLGSYACRNINHGPGVTSTRRSQHATANALDLAGFVLSDGTRIMVEKGWQGEGPEAAFLRAVRDGACRRFNVVLSPDYNWLHRDHFHLDMGPYRSCR
jgi:hypothetical protein